jgi:hypothetical protein
MRSEHSGPGATNRSAKKRKAAALVGAAASIDRILAGL